MKSRRETTSPALSRWSSTLLPGVSCHWRAAVPFHDAVHHREPEADAEAEPHGDRPQWRVAVADGRLVGAARASGRNAEVRGGWIAELAVLPEYRGRGVARGAVGGLVIGNVAGGSGSKGAAAGALMGGLSSGARDNRRRSAQQQSAAQSQQSYNRAYGACLEGRGYTVR